MPASQRTKTRVYYPTDLPANYPQRVSQLRTHLFALFPMNTTVGTIRVRKHNRFPGHSEGVQVVPSFEEYVMLSYVRRDHETNLHVCTKS